MRQFIRDREHLRLIPALIVAMVVWWVCLDVGKSMGPSPPELTQWSEGMLVEDVGHSVEAYRKKYGRLPQNIAQLQNSPDQPPLQDGRVLNLWGHPLVYQVRGDSYLVSSYGRDGKAGGVGFDCDISNRNLHPAEASVPLLQFALDSNSGPTLLASLLSAAIGFFLTFCLMYPADFDSREFRRLTVKLAFILLIALCTGFGVMSIQMVSGK